MKTHTFSIVVGTAACNAACPFCVGKMTMAPHARPNTEIRWDRFETACKIVEQARDGLVSVTLTGRGEPMLYPDEIGKYLDRMNRRFPLVEIQTNGICIGDNLKQLWSWQKRGLTQVSISITHTDPAHSNKIMGIKTQYNYWEAVKRVKATGLSVRLNCTMIKTGISRPEQVDRLIAMCAVNGVDKLTLREVEAPATSRDVDVTAWVRGEKPHGAAKRLRHYLELKEATPLLVLPHGGIVYDVAGQNVAVSNCLTGTTNPDDIRQIIFFPDGRIAYDWRYPGARIL